MLTPAEAEQIILQNVTVLPNETCLLREAAGHVLREEIAADRDFPPFDRATMDGYALPSSALGGTRRTFAVAGLQLAGAAPTTLACDDQCVEIATGAVLPAGANCVIPYEQTTRDGTLVTLAESVVLRSQLNVHPQGSDAKAGSVLVKAGTRLTSREIAVAAACGKSELKVVRSPRIFLITTGSELVPVETLRPTVHEIRRSNEIALASTLRSAGFTQVECHAVADERDALSRLLKRALAEADLVIFTGGISKGKMDLLPKVLASASVTQMLRGVAQRPGKPLWFGLSPQRLPVFALPGNPVSCYVCLHRYVLPALRVMTGQLPLRPVEIPLAKDVQPLPNLAFFLPVSCDLPLDHAGAKANPAPFNTSGDFVGLVGTHGFVELAPGAGVVKAGTRVPFWRWLD